MWNDNKNNSLQQRRTYHEILAIIFLESSLGRSGCLNTTCGNFSSLRIQRDEG